MSRATYISRKKRNRETCWRQSKALKRVLREAMRKLVAQPEISHEAAEAILNPEDRPQYYVFDRGSTEKQRVYQLGKCMDDLLQLIRLCPSRDTEHSMSMKGYTSEQNMTTVEDGYNTADDGGPLQIRESSGYEEQHSRSFHETS